MILQEKIKKEAEGYGKLAPAFIEGARFALEINGEVLKMIYHVIMKN